MLGGDFFEVKVKENSGIEIVFFFGFSSLFYTVLGCILFLSSLSILSSYNTKSSFLSSIVSLFLPILPAPVSDLQLSKIISKEVV